MSLYNHILYALQLIFHSRVYSRTLFALLNYLHVFYVWFGNAIGVRDLDYNNYTNNRHCNASFPEQYFLSFREAVVIFRCHQ